MTTDGSLTVTLLDQIDHTFGDNVESNLAINLGGLIAVVDEDGDALAAASGDIVLNIGDDIPQIIGTTPVTLQLDEDASGLAPTRTALRCCPARRTLANRRRPTST